VRVTLPYAKVASAGLLGGVALVLFLGAGCRVESLSAPEVRLYPASGDMPARVEVVGLDSSELSGLRARALSRDEWAAVFRLAVADDQPAMLGDYAVTGDGVTFTPRFPLDAGREYVVTFRAAAIPGIAADDRRGISARVSLPAVVREPTTVVAHVYPSAGIVPENQLRLYIHFSAPMGRKGGLDYITLVDEEGHAVDDPFLPLDAEFWNGDRTRYTVFFDPGRQKRGILPNQQMGRSLEPGKRYALVVSREWRDGSGLPLREDFRRSFQVGPADERPIDVARWRLSAPSADSLDPLVANFPEPLDHGLLLRALGVTGADGRFIDGDVRVDQGETRWAFTPRAPWRAGAYNVTALAMLEDLAGNRVGRAFEVDRFDRADRAEEVERTSLPFVVAAR
jgi:hypothetical protein